MESVLEQIRIVLRGEGVERTRIESWILLPELQKLRSWPPFTISAAPAYSSPVDA